MIIDLEVKSMIAAVSLASSFLFLLIQIAADKCLKRQIHCDKATSRK
ncbi:hypothetical protein [Pseudomonas moorei]|nr:hypothetical protein [Pseudomonas moorei]